MGNADSRRSLVDMLSPGAAASVGIDAQILLVDLHVQIFLNIRHHVQRHKGGLALPLRIKGGYPHQPVHTLLRLQVAVGIHPVDLESH